MTRQIPPLNPLRAFEVAARLLSFTKAGEELFVTPSAVSHQIKVLEDSLGVPLFVRQAKSLELTPAGQAYLPEVQIAFKQIASATRRLHAKDLSALKINTPPTFAVKWLIPRMAQFMEANPTIDLKVSTSATMVDFSRDNIDLAIYYGRTDTYPGLRSIKCLSVEVFPVCSPALMDGPHPLLTPADLKFHTLLHDDSTYVQAKNPDWATWLDHVGQTDIDATRGPSFWPSHLVINAAVDGLGVALAKKHWVFNELATGKLVRPFEESIPVDYAYFIAFPPDRDDDPRISMFVEWVQHEVAESEVAYSKIHSAPSQHISS